MVARGKVFKREALVTNRRPASSTILEICLRLKLYFTIRSLKSDRQGRFWGHNADQNNNRQSWMVKQGHVLVGYNVRKIYAVVSKRPKPLERLHKVDRTK
jgi:hypothetical protein